MATVVRVRKWGNGLAIRLPRSFASQRAIINGTSVVIDGLAVVDASRLRRGRYKLKDLLKNYLIPPHSMELPSVGQEL